MFARKYKNMYKELLLFRHGKASLNYNNISDIDRSLTEQGVIDVYNMANRLKTKNIKPNIIISSCANRALHTATIIARELNISTLKIDIVEELYLADIETIFSIINQINNNITSLMIVGHNPTLTDLANYFTNRNIDNILPSGIVSLKFKTQSWSDITQQKPVESFFDFP